MKAGTADRLSRPHRTSPSHWADTHVVQPADGSAELGAGLGFLGDYFSHLQFPGASASLPHLL